MHSFTSTMPNWLIHCRKLFEKRLTRALGGMDQTIGNLHADLKILLVESSSTAANRQTRVLDVHRDVNKPYHNFCQFFAGLKAEEKGDIRQLALEQLWGQFGQLPDPILDLGNKVGNPADPGDGILYEQEHINLAERLLKDLHQAWVLTEHNSSYPPPAKLPKMGMICLILTGMRQQPLLEDFLNSEICDDDLHLNRAQLQDILRKQPLDCVGTFLSEQYRAKPRPWNEGHHAKMEDEEPLPLKYELHYKNGSYGNVTRVRDPFSDTLYALKKQINVSAESRNVCARRHLKDEMERLKGLKHKHVIKLVKSYERADSYGLLLAPAADCDLVGLFDRFRRNRPYARLKCADQTWLRPQFLTAFGCLSKGLAYIHGQGIRHKDIKPGNILYELPRKEHEEGRFLWADFGLAYDFNATGNSKTHSTKIYSKRYAAPEILSASINPARTERRASMMDLDRIVENGQASRDVEASKPEEKILSEFRETKETSHGRKTDIFSLGCVFLELLAVLVHDKLPMDNDDGKPDRRFSVDNQQLPDGGRIASAPIAIEDDMFCKHIQELKSWAQLHSTHSNTQSNDPTNVALAPLLTLATKMISLKAEDRPLIDEVVREVAAIGSQHFCHTCLTELPIEQPAAVNEKAVKPKRTGSVSPETPGSGSGSPMSLLRRSTAYFQSDSHGPGSQLMRIMSR